MSQFSENNRRRHTPLPGKNLLYYYSIYHIQPDPIKPFLDSILDSVQDAGVYTTPLYQYKTATI